MSGTATYSKFETLAAEVGELMHNWGFKRIHGRIWTHLFLAPRPLDASDLIRRMNISKALASISLRELLEARLILEAGKSGRGANLYRTNANWVAVARNVLQRREKRNLDRIHASLRALASADSISVGDDGGSCGPLVAADLCPARLAQLGTLIETVTAGLNAFVARHAANDKPNDATNDDASGGDGASKVEASSARSESGIQSRPDLLVGAGRFAATSDRQEASLVPGRWTAAERRTD